jgi:hypothetical protein
VVAVALQRIRSFAASKLRTIAFEQQSGRQSSHRELLPILATLQSLALSCPQFLVTELIKAFPGSRKDAGHELLVAERWILGVTVLAVLSAPKQPGAVLPPESFKELGEVAIRTCVDTSSATTQVAKRSFLQKEAVKQRLLSGMEKRVLQVWSRVLGAISLVRPGPIVRHAVDEVAATKHALVKAAILRALGSFALQLPENDSLAFLNEMLHQLEDKKAPAIVKEAALYALECSLHMAATERDKARSQRTQTLLMQAGGIAVNDTHSSSDSSSNQPLCSAPPCPKHIALQTKLYHFLLEMCEPVPASSSANATIVTPGAALKVVCVLLCSSDDIFFFAMAKKFVGIVFRTALECDRKQVSLVCFRPSSVPRLLLAPSLYCSAGSLHPNLPQAKKDGKIKGKEKAMEDRALHQRSGLQCLLLLVHSALERSDAAKAMEHCEEVSAAVGSATDLPSSSSSINGASSSGASSNRLNGGGVEAAVVKHEVRMLLRRVVLKCFTTGEDPGEDSGKIPSPSLPYHSVLSPSLTPASPRC